VNNEINKQNREPELAEKQTRLKRFMSEQGLDAILLSRHENISWATAGLVDLRIGVPRETGAGSLLYTRHGESFYLTTNNEAPRQAAEEFIQLNYEPVVQPWYANDVQASVTKVVGAGKVGADVPMGFSSPIQIASLRYQLTDGEIDRYRWLGKNAAAAASAVIRELRPGMTETTMQTALAEQLLSRNIMPSVYLTAVDDRVRIYRHAVPRSGVLQHFGMINFCARRWGLAVSMTRFVYFGTMPAELSEKFAAVFIVNAKLLDATKEGRSADELFAVARDTYASEGYAGEEMMHHQGGATGYVEREWVARPGGQERVLHRQAFAWNPNLGGAKVEDTIVQQSDKIEVLTETPDLPVVTTSIAGRNYYSSGVLMF
jgi:Xaa-Pro dipeptidase